MKHELNVVVLDKGKKDEVSVGYVFDVYLGSTYRGRLRVTDVQATMYTGTILCEKNEIAKGDSASTRL